MHRAHRALVALLVVLAPPAAGWGAEAVVTFNKDIAPIVFEHCAACHRPGEVAPFSLLSYADVHKRARQIREVTASRFMPPWKSVEGHGRFVGERRLSAEQVARIARWVEQGAPEGAAGDLPPRPEFRDGWKLGQPDIVITMAEAYSVPADGPDIYRNFVFPLAVPAGKYIKAAEYRPGNRRVVHHAALAIDRDGTARRQDEADPQPGFKGSLTLPGQLFPGSLSAWTPGRDAMPLQPGFSLPWKAGWNLLLQIHLHPSGKPETELSSIGLYLTDEAPRRSMADVVLIDKKIDIPAGEKEYRTKDEFTLPIDMEALGLFPHMHLIGRDMKITAHPPGGEAFSLVWINDWDFNWQNFYEFAEPVKLPAGTRIVLEAIHDNSADNIRNPSNPPQRVTWGEQTTNEMSAAILQLALLREQEMPKLAGSLRGRLLGGITATQSTAAAAIAAPAHSAELIFPLHPNHNHAPGIVEAPNGDLLATWYRGSGERSADDVAVYGSRRKKGASNWDEPYLLADTPGFPDCNTALFIDRQQQLWLFYPTILANSWKSCLTNFKVASRYDGAGVPRWDREGIIFLKPDDFGPAAIKLLDQQLGERAAELSPERKARLDELRRRLNDKLLQRLGWQPRCKPTLLPSGRMLLPLYSDTYSFSIMAITDDGGKTWKASQPLMGFGSIQPAVLRRNDGTLVAYMRENGARDRVRVAESKDDGLTWGPVGVCDLPNPGSGLDGVRLASGRWLLVYNDTTQGRNKLAVSLSADEGKSWSKTRHLENHAEGQYHYPAVTQGADGTVHCVYSYFVAGGKSMKHAAFNETWIEAGNPN